MNKQEIIDNAPEGATHVEVLTDYKKIYYYRRCYKDFCNKFMYDVYQQGTWYICSDISGEFRSLADIRRIAELESIAYSVQSADLCYGSYSTYEIDSSVVEKAKNLLKEQD
jgi:hypothetical protein